MFIWKKPHPDFVPIKPTSAPGSAALSPSSLSQRGTQDKFFALTTRPTTAFSFERFFLDHLWRVHPDVRPCRSSRHRWQRYRHPHVGREDGGLRWKELGQRRRRPHQLCFQVWLLGRSNGVGSCDLGSNLAGSWAFFSVCKSQSWALSDEAVLTCVI